MGNQIARTTLVKKITRKSNKQDMRQSLRKKKQEFINHMKKEQLFMAYSN